LDGGGALHRVDHAGELDQSAVAHQLDDAPVMRLDRRIDAELAMRLERLERARFIFAHETRISDHIGRQYCRESSLQDAFPCTAF
jgi:hypothetical protein